MISTSYWRPLEKGAYPVSNGGVTVPDEEACHHSPGGDGQDEEDEELCIGGNTGEERHHRVDRTCVRDFIMSINLGAAMVDGY